MKVFILLALIGCSLAYTPGMEYKYQYEGTLKMGLPEIREKFSGVGIKAIVHVQLQSQDKAVIQLTQIKIGEFVGDSVVNMIEALPMEYNKMTQHTQALEQPFEVYFRKENNVMVVPESDLEWMVNLRKSIAQLFVVEPLRKNVDLTTTTNTIKKSFTTQEPTLFGSCSVDYTINDISETQSQNEDTLLMTRSINFDKCEEEVKVMHSTINPLINFSKGSLGNVASRSSVMTYKLVGTSGNFVIQEGKVQGFIAVNPFGIPTDKLMSLTDQTIILESQNRITNQLVVPSATRYVKSWYMEVASAFSAPANPISFVNYYNKRDAKYTPYMTVNTLTGIPLSHEYIQKYEMTLEKMIEDVAQLMLTVGTVPQEKVTPLSTTEGKIISILNTARFVVRGVDLQRLESLFNKYYQDSSDLGQLKLSMLIDVCASSETLVPMKMLLKQMKQQRITPERITSLFVTFPSNFAATPILPEFMEFVKMLDMDTNPIMTTNVWINFASTLKKVCITKKTVPYQIFGKETCDQAMIINDFVQFLKEKFQKYTESYKQCTVIQALSNLGTTEAFEFIATVIKGDYDVKVKEIAILSFDYPKVKHVFEKDMIFDLLMPIVHDIEEDSFLRQCAISTLVQWQPTTSFWYRLAALSWREPSKSVGSFIYNVMRNNYYNTDIRFSHLAKIMHFVLPLTKPMPSSSYANYFYAKTNSEEFTNTFFHQTVLKDDTSSMPRGYYGLLTGDFGGVSATILEAAFSTSMVPNKENVETNVSGELINFIKKQIISTDMNTENMHRESSIYLNLLQKLQFVLPINSETFPLNQKMDNFNFLNSITRDQTLHFSKFWNPVSFEIFLPTELGIPFVGKLSTPIVQSAEGKVEFNREDKHSFSMTVDFKPSYKLVTKAISTFEAIVPWNQKMIKSGVESLKSINLPFKMKFILGTQDNKVQVSFDLKSTHDQEFPVFTTHNIPFVARKSMWPGQLVKDYEVYEIVSQRKDERGIHQDKFALDEKRFGLDGSIYWEGDVPYLFTSGNIWENIESPEKMINKLMSPTSKFFASAITLNFGRSETKTIHVSTLINPTQENQEYSLKIKTDGTQQRYYETTLKTKDMSRDNKVQRYEISYQHIQQTPQNKPQVYCVKAMTHGPNTRDVTTLLQNLDSNTMEYSIIGKVYGGISCEDRPIATIKGSFTVSDWKKVDLKKIINQELKMKKDQEDILFELEEAQVYDNVKIFVEYNEPLPVFFTNLTYQAYDILRSSQFPHFSSNHFDIQNPKGKIQIEGERLFDGAWKLEAKLPKENIHLQHFEIPTTYLVPLLVLPNQQPKTNTFNVKEMDNKYFF